MADQHEAEGRNSVLLYPPKRNESKRRNPVCVCVCVCVSVCVSVCGTAAVVERSTYFEREGFMTSLVSIFFSLLALAAVYVYGGGATPNIMHNLLLVKVPTFVDGIRIREYVGVGARFGPPSESNKDHVKEAFVTLSDPPDCCSTVRNKLAGGAVLVYRGNCSFTAKANNAKAAGASAIIIVNNDTNILKMVCEDDPNTDISIPAVMLPLDAGEELEALLSNHSMVSVQLYSHRGPSVDVTEVFPWIMAVGSILCACYWSTLNAREASLELDTLKNLHDKALSEAADKNIVLQNEIAHSEQVIQLLEEKMDDCVGQVSALENMYTEELLKSNAFETELDVLKLALRNEIETYTQTIKAVKEMLDASAELVKLREEERDGAVKLSRDLVESREDFFLTLPSADILKAADQSSQLLYEGELGNMYKAVLYHTEVTIRFLPEKELLVFENEVKILSKFRHPNLATLVGACPETLALVYEHLPNGNLVDRLRRKGDSLPLPWQTRIKIGVELCSALIFLHSHGVTHSALRPSCVFLDSNFTCKIIDFRLSHKGDKSDPSALNYIGEYADPEFLRSREASPSSDVYSFGLMLLELLTAKPGFTVVEEVKSCLDQGSLNIVLDTSAGEWPYLLAQQLAHLGLRCCHVDSKSRPDIPSDVWKVLEPMRRSCSSASSTSKDGEAPSYFICPIVLDVMEDPHIAADGYTYEAEALKLWLDRGHNTSPMTNLPLDNTRLIPNRALLSAVREWQHLQRQ